MKPIVRRIVTSVLLLLAVLGTGCSSSNSYIKIQKPEPNQKFLATPNTLLVFHEGCGHMSDGTLRAWIDKGTSTEQDIGDYFTYEASNDRWISSTVNLPVGQHTLSAYAVASPSGWCNKNRSQSTDTRDITVVNIPDRPVSIMPLGDSITRGCCPTHPDCDLGYRYRLYRLLTNAGYKIKFVGSEVDPRHPRCPINRIPKGFTRNHEGHYNKKAEELIGEISGILESNPPDVILLHIGTNDLRNASIQPADVVARVSEILNHIDAFENAQNHEITVLLALIINQKTTNDRVSLFNEQLRDMAEVRIAANDKIILVDMENGAGLDYENDMKDIFHPNEAGYEKMANLWYRRLVNFLPSP